MRLEDDNRAFDALLFGFVLERAEAALFLRAEVFFFDGAIHVPPFRSEYAGKL